MSKPSYVYVTYIATTAEKIWQALTDTDVTRRYWGAVAKPVSWENVSDWKPGSDWHQRRADDPKTIGVEGKVLEATPPRRLVLTWYCVNTHGPRSKNPEATDLMSRVTFDIEPQKNGVVKLTVVHEDLDEKLHRGISMGWPQVLSNLKTLLETGSSLPAPALSA